MKKKKPDVVIRAARPADARRLAELRWGFRSPLARPQEGRAAFVRRCAAWMRSRLHTGAWRCWVATRKGEIVGHVWACVFEKIPNPNRRAEPERHGYLSNLYVAEEARGGTGTTLLRRALAWCDRQRVHEVLLWPTPASRSLYRRHGFRPGRHLMSRG